MSIPTPELQRILDDLMTAEESSVFRLFGTTHQGRTEVALHIAALLFQGVLPKKARTTGRPVVTTALLSRNFTEKAKAMRSFTSMICKENEGFWRVGTTLHRSIGLGSVSLLFTESGKVGMSRLMRPLHVVITDDISFQNSIFGYLAEERVVIIALSPYTEGDTERAPAGKLMSEYCLPQILWEPPS
jgi:hypothetical protein